MSGLSRRVFLKSGSAAIVAAGAITALPGLPAVTDAVESQGPADAGATESALTEAESSAVATEPLIAHVRDLATGEISLLTGTREVTVLDPKLAASLVRALR